MFQAHFVDFRHQRISLIRPQPKDVVDDPLLERGASRIKTVDSADFNDEFQRILPHLRVFVTDPLACELGQLLVVLAEDACDRLGREMVGTFDQLRTLYEQAQPANDRLLAKLGVADDLGNHGTH